MTGDLPGVSSNILRFRDVSGAVGAGPSSELFANKRMEVSERVMEGYFARGRVYPNFIQTNNPLPLNTIHEVVSETEWEIRGSLFVENQRIVATQTGTI